ncbi:unnamed protein product [Pedinophyceae sp. YPF-701]|nr:unnamed protein product [Pedinophyceae sp. YPF-701]
MMENDRYGNKGARDPVMVGVRWLKSRSNKDRTMLGAAGAVLALLLLYFIIEDHDVLFVLAEGAQLIGILILMFKTLHKKSCAGLSLQTQILTATFLTIRLYCSLMMEFDVHTVLDFLTLAATAFVIVTMMTKLKHTYNEQLDTVKPWIVGVPCLVLAIIAHPNTKHMLFNRILWATCVYLEAVSVYPQLKMFQNAKIVERFTGHYLFLLGISRFFSCAHWILQLFDKNSFLLRVLGTGLWPPMVLLAEAVQTFILADFCYLYVKSYSQGIPVIRIPAGIV